MTTRQEDSHQEERTSNSNDRLRRWKLEAKKSDNMEANTSKHAAAAVVTPGKLADHLPTERDRKDDEIITQFDGDQLEELGLLKIDVLGLKTLRTIRVANDIVEETTGQRVPQETLDSRDDQKVYEEVFGEGDTAGIFQFKSGGMQKFLEDMKPWEFTHIAAMNALYRPGPMENIPDFIDRMHGEKDVVYIDESIHDAIKDDVADVLDDTYGIMVFQEQVMKVCQRLAGFSLGDADIMRRCMPGDTLVVDAETGERRRVDSVEPGTSILTLDDDYKLTETTVAERHENGTKPVFEVTTRSGRTIELTKDHPLRTIEGWQHLSDLSEGDAIAVPASLPASGTESPPEERMRVLAYLIGDGQTLTSAGRATNRFYSSDSDMLSSYCDAVAKLGAEPNISDHPTTDVKTVTTSGLVKGQAPITALVRETGLDEKAAGKRLPKEVFRYDTEALAEFVGYLFDTDGGFEETRVSYSSASKGLIDDVAHVLLRLGVTTMRFHREIEDHQDNFELIIGDQRDILKFAEAVGPHLCPRRKKALDALVRKVSSKSRNQSVYNLPAEITYAVKRAKYASGRTWKEGGQMVGREGRNLSSGLNFSNPNQKLSRHRTEELGRAFSSNELVNIARGDVLWDPIVEITEVGEKEVYDLSVPPHANFVTSDVVVHNSISKKKPELLEEQREKFIDGCVNEGYDRALGETIFELIENFADYAFNRAHSSSYAAIAYQQAYFKTYHPTAFFTAAIRTSPLKTQKDNAETKTDLMQDAEAHGIDVLPPSVNDSGHEFTAMPEKEQIRFGLGTVKNVGKEAQKIIDEREENGPYESFMDFAMRAIPNLRAVKSLIKAGAFDEFDLTRKAMFEQKDEIMTYVRKMGDYRTGSRVTEPEKPQVVDKREWPAKVCFQQERDVAGIYTTGQPIDAYPELVDLYDGREYRREQPQSGTSDYMIHCGSILSISEATTSTGKPMWWVRFITPDDGIIEHPIFEWRYKDIRDSIEKDVAAIIVTRADAHGEYAGMYSIENVVPMREIENGRGKRSAGAGRLPLPC